MFHADSLPGNNGGDKGTLKQMPRQRTDQLPLLSLFILCILTLLSCGINADSDKDGLPDDKDRCPTQHAKTKDGCLPEEKIEAIRFFIDKSASMDGYYKGGTDFVHNIGSLLAKIDDDIKPIKEIWEVSDSMELFPGTADAFRQQLPRVQPNGRKSSMMDQIFEKIANTTDKKDIAIFVSDGILSFPDQDIRKNKNINKENADNLHTAIYITFSRLKKQKDFGVSLYAFKSGFTGRYFNYQNTPIKLTNATRPYYVWIAGKKNLLRKFDATLKDFPTFRPEQELHFGLQDSAVTSGNIITQLNHVGDWTLSDDGKGINDIGKGNARFTIAVNLSQLPPYAQTIDYLKEHLQVKPEDCVLSSFEIKDKKDVDVTKIHSERQKELFSNATHIISIDLKQLNTKNARVFLLLPAAINGWYQEWSCDDDLNLKKDCTGKTFAFRYLVEGIKEAYEQTDKNYISITIPLKQ